MNITTRIEKIGPARAHQLLEKNHCNRQVDAKRVKLYAEEMLAGRWRLNGEPIIFSEQRLMSGQHRFLSVIEANVEVEFLIVEGVQDDVFATLESGAPRRFANVLQTQGVSNSKLIGTAILVLWQMGHPKGYGFARTVMCPSSRLESMKWALPELAESATWVNGFVAFKKIVPRGFVVALRAATMRGGAPERAHAFFEQLATGENAGPIPLLLRDKLIGNAATRVKSSQLCVKAWIIRAWNAWYEGRELKLIKWSTDQSFPLVSGARFDWR